MFPANIWIRRVSERVIPAPPARATLAGDFRCGILHPVEIKAGSKVRRVGPLVASTPDGKGLIINRKLFHATLRKAFAGRISVIAAMRCYANTSSRK